MLRDLKNLTERDLVWGWRILILICAIFTACSASYVASSIMVAQFKLWQISRSVSVDMP